MKRLLAAAALAALCVGASAQTPPAAQTPAQQAYEQQLREAAAARARYEAAQAQYQRDLARNQRDVARAQAAQDAYQRRMAERNPHGASTNRVADTPAPVRDSAPVATAAAEHTQIAPSEQCQAQQRRNRRRGRLIGGIIGGVAGVAGSQVRHVGALAALAVPAGVLLGDAIARLLDCHEQQQAATATEDAVRGGVGTTTTWTSETRPNVTGSSTVVAMQSEPGGAECVDVTDVVIVDGQETRAPKHLCRRPPSNRFVRV
jgi:Skp family chaperone for outer membrane proteins